nr:putative glycoside hydrolase, family 32 [Tanacetum cinerariifolium]
MARCVSDYRIRRIADRGNEKDGPDSRNISEIKGLWRRVRDLEIQHEIRQIRKRIRELELQREMRKETESRYVVRDDVNEKEDILRLIPTPRKGDEASNGVMEPHANKDTVDFGLYVKNDFFNKIGLVDCGPQDQMGRKDYEGPTTSSLDVLNSLSSKIATTKCVGAELFERFKLIAKSDRSNAPYDPGGTGLIPGETTCEVKLFGRVMVTLINGSRVDVPFDTGDFALKAKLEDEFFRRGGE